MAKNPDKPEEGSEFNKIDLSTFEEFSFGTQWTPATGPGDGAQPERRERPRREGRPPSRDRRPPRRSGPRDGEDRRSGDSRPGGPGGPRPDRRRSARDDGPRRSFRDQEPYISRLLEVAFYPEDHGFNALVKAMRTSCRTYELFEIARLILGKSERCVAVFRRIPQSEDDKSKLVISIPDGMPFGTEEVAIQHVINHHLETFFDVEEIEVDPPKGSFQMVHRCPFTKELLAPPNFHRYAHIVEQHHAAKVSRMSLERFKDSLESTREPEDIQAWLDKMKKATRYTAKAEVSDESGTFDSPEEARTFLLRVARAKMIKTSDNARVDAKVVEKYPETEAFRTMEGALERQRRFPLDTANALRGRLRRENFHIFKRGSKGITYACSVRRKFRVAGQSFSDSVEKLVQYLEANPMTPIGALPDRYLGIPIHGSQEENHEEIENLPDEKKEAIKKMAMDLRWLVTEGYVAEYSDGRLFAAPAETRPVAQKKPKAPKATPAKVEPEAAPETPVASTVRTSTGSESPSKDVAAPAETVSPETGTEATGDVEGSTESVPEAVKPDAAASEPKPESGPAEEPTEVAETPSTAEVVPPEEVKPAEPSTESVEQEPKAEVKEPEAPVPAEASEPAPTVESVEEPGKKAQPKAPAEAKEPTAKETESITDEAPGPESTEKPEGSK